MKVQLKDYQVNAVDQLLKHLETATRIWEERGEMSAISLSAVTGSGKTVIAAAVLEALFHGSSKYVPATAKKPVLLWLSDSPSLNQQTYHRLDQVASSDVLKSQSMEIIDSNITKFEKLEPKKVYFLNIQKLRSGGRISGKQESNSENFEILDDYQTTTIWNILKNTLEDKDLILYFVLDEAHRGMNGKPLSENDKSTVRNLIDGQIRGGVTVPAMPIVLGISATSERFIESMTNSDRNYRPNVEIPISDVRVSGLVKETLNIEVPRRVGKGALIAFIERGAKKYSSIYDAWQAYCLSETELSEHEVVRPLMILQVPNDPDNSDVGKWVDAIVKKCGGRIRSENIFNVLGDQRSEIYGNFHVEYIPPERVQESSHVRLLIAKDAISTGWDCPRAEVMVSLRPARDKTYITQLIGRMMRTPLARSILEHGRLNEVDCILPRFNPDTVNEVVKGLGGGDTNEEGLLRNILTNPILLERNHQVPEEVWNELEEKITYELSKGSNDPVSRLKDMAHLLSEHKIVDSARNLASQKIYSMLDRVKVDYQDEFAEARKKIQNIEATSITVFDGKDIIESDFVLDTNDAHIMEHFRFAKSVLTPSIALGYVNHIASKSNGKDYETDLVDARIDVSAIARIENVEKLLHTEVENILGGWISNNDYQVQIRDLPRSVQQEFLEIEHTGSAAIEKTIIPPTSFSQYTSIRRSNGKLDSVPTYKYHIYSDSKGNFPVDLNNLEKRVIMHELNRTSTVAWYRNVPKGSLSSLGAVYVYEDVERIVRPDFIIFSRNRSGRVVSSIVDPHGAHLSDSLPKLIGMAKYAEKHHGSFSRIQCVVQLSKSKDNIVCLDMKDARTRQVVKSSKSLQDIFNKKKIVRNYFS